MHRRTISWRVSSSSSDVRTVRNSRESRPFTMALWHTWVEPSAPGRTNDLDRPGSAGKRLGPDRQDLEEDLRPVRGQPRRLHVERAGDLHVTEGTIQVPGGRVAVVDAGGQRDRRKTSFTYLILELDHQRSSDALVPAPREDLEIVHHRMGAELQAELRFPVVRPVDPDVADGLVSVPGDQVGERSPVLSRDALTVLERRAVPQCS